MQITALILALSLPLSSAGQVLAQGVPGGGSGGNEQSLADKGATKLE